MMACLLAAGAVALSVGSNRVPFDPETQRHWKNCTTVSVESVAAEIDFAVTCTATSTCETAWHISSGRMRIPPEASGYALDFEIYSDTDWISCGTSESYETALVWCGTDGKPIGRRSLPLAFRKKAFTAFRFSGAIPENADSAIVEFGVDDPNLRPSCAVRVRKTTLSILAAGTPIPREIVYDMVPPMVTSRFESPSEDPNLVVRYEIADNETVDWESVCVTNCGTKASVPFVRSGNVITLRPDAPWSEGMHALQVSVCDVSGNLTVSRKVFLIGRKPPTPSVAVRDDGAVLVDGQPFFPIGLYGIKPHEFNAWNYDRAFGDLKAAGFNFGHAYEDSRAGSFLAAAGRHGFRMWTDARFACRGKDEWLVGTGRHDRNILAWYIGDDTAMNTKPSELLDRNEAVKMLDGTRISCQADTVCGGLKKSAYQDYVNYSDVFMPELYHVYNADRAKDGSCVAFVIRDMDRACADAKRFATDGRPKSIWPILQCFHGRTWKRYPDADEIYAMSLAALIHGGNGITWFHYAGALDLARGRHYSGLFRTKEDWAVMTNLTTRLSALAPVFLERKPRQPQPPEIVDGAKTDPLGRPSVSVLVKVHAGSTYVFAVNASPKPARARVFVTVPDGEGSVAWEKRKVAARGGSFEDNFGGFGVHVYRFR